MTEGSSPILEVENLSIHYGSFCALENINLQVAAGEFIGIIGPNGGGKTTFIKALMNLIKPTEGRIRIKGLPPRMNRTLIGYVPQFINFNRRFPISVEEVVLLGMLSPGFNLFRLSRNQDRDRAQMLLEQVGMLHFRTRQIGGLSVGELQRVLMARALATSPEILILDEPTASVDAHATTVIYDILKELNRDMTILLISHDISTISANVGKIACLNRRLYYHGEPQLNQEIIEAVYGCPVEIIAHGDIPHRVLRRHKEFD